MGSIIRANRTIYYSLLYFNSQLGFDGLKCVYSVISVIDKRLPGNTKRWTIASFVDGQSAISRILGGNEWHDSCRNIECRNIHSFFFKYEDVNLHMNPHKWRYASTYESSSYVQHDSFIRAAWLIHTCGMTHSYVRHDSFIRAAWLIHTCGLTHSYVRHDSFIRAAWLIHMCDLNHSCVWHEAFMCDMSHSYVWHESFICAAWLIHMCSTTHPYIWHDSFIRVTWLIHACNMTHSYVWQAIGEYPAESWIPFLRSHVIKGWAPVLGNQFETVLLKSSALIQGVQKGVHITHCNTLQHTATHCNTLQHTATHCNTLQHGTHCNTLQHEWGGKL